MSDRISHERPQRQAERNESGLSSSVVTKSTKDTSDGFVRHAILSGNLAQGFVAFNDTAHHVWPFIKWDGMVRLTWTWMLLFGNERRNTAKHLLQCEKSVIELAMWCDKVDQHW